MMLLLYAFSTAMTVVAQQQVPAEWWGPLIQGGSFGAAMGSMVIWFAFRMEKILEKLRDAMERNTNALMVAVLNTQHLDAAIKPLAERLERESSEARKK